MVEYLYDAIMAFAGEPIGVTAIITDDAGTSITDNCVLVVYDELSIIFSVDGEYLEEVDTWHFEIPPDKTAGLNGRYFYAIKNGEDSLAFKQPLYLV